ncbi:MAG TPA: hypothetical protein VK308_07220, partial [Pyrinomonadaceae bacterium]|nr:hypothetical protein [Pyrinomonadaceae bacterium]
YGFRLFNAYGSAESNNREKTLEAVAYMEKSLSLRKEIVESGRATMKDSRNLADQYLMTGIPILASGKTATAIENFRRSREMFQTILFADLQNVEASRDMANALYWLGVGLTQDGKKAEAREQFLAAQKIVQNLLSREHTKEDSDLLKGIEDKMKLL